MPVMDGMEVLETIETGRFRNIFQYLIVSTESNESMIKQIEMLGSGFVHKPFTPGDASRRDL